MIKQARLLALKKSKNFSGYTLIPISSIISTITMAPRQTFRMQEIVIKQIGRYQILFINSMRKYLRGIKDSILAVK